MTVLQANAVVRIGRVDEGARKALGRLVEVGAIRCTSLNKGGNNEHEQ